jgi:hypothetical protein
MFAPLQKVSLVLALLGGIFLIIGGSLNISNDWAFVALGAALVVGAYLRVRTSSHVLGDVLMIVGSLGLLAIWWLIFTLVVGLFVIIVSIMDIGHARENQRA